MEVFLWIEKSVRVNSRGNTYHCGSLTRHSMEIHVLALRHFQLIQTKQGMANRYIRNRTRLFEGD